MATWKSQIITAKEQLSVSAKQIDGDITGGDVRFATALVTLATGMAANDTLQLCDLPAGAVVVPQLCSVTGADAGQPFTVDIGDALDPDRYADGLDLGAANGQKAFTAPAVPDAVLNPYRLPAQTRIYATIMTATAVTNGAVLSFLIAYRAKG